MLSLPIAFRRTIGIFAPVFSRPVWQSVQGLMTGAVLAPGQRTVPAILRLMGRRAAPHFQTYHRVLNRAVWSPLHASRRLLRLFVAMCVPRGVVLCGLDDTIERRRGEPMTATGLYREPVRSAHTHRVQASGLRWLGGYVADSHSMGPAGLGLARSDGVGSFRALLGPARPSPSHRAGTRLAEQPTRAALVAWARGRLGGGQPLCGAGMARPGGAMARCQCAHAPAARGGAL
jgi:hypothetical protein